MALTSEQKKKLKSDARQLAAFTSVGKFGVTENTITQIQTYLKAHKLAKIKVLRSFLDESGLDKKVVAQQLADKTGAELVDLVGLTVVLWKR